MDFTKLNTKTGASKGAFMHLKHPALGHYLYTGEGADDEGRAIDKSKAKKVGLHVLGTESEIVRQRARAINKERMKGDEADDAGLEFVCTLVTGFVGLEKDGKPIEATEENKAAFFQQSDDFVTQVVSFAQDNANFFKRG